MKILSLSFAFLKNVKGMKATLQLQEHGLAICSKHMVKIGIEKYICRYGGFAHYATAKKQPSLERKTSQNTYQRFTMIFLQSLRSKSLRIKVSSDPRDHRTCAPCAAFQ